MALSLAEAQERLPDLIQRAQSDGPQTVEVEGQGDDAVVVISVRETSRAAMSKPSLKDLLLSMESLEDVDLSRDQTPARDIDL